MSDTCFIAVRLEHNPLYCVLLHSHSQTDRPAQRLQYLSSTVLSKSNFWFCVSFAAPPPTGTGTALPRVQPRAKMLSLVICPWSGISISPSWNHSLKYLISIAMMLLAILEKGFECFCTMPQFDWMNQNCLCFSKPVLEKSIHPSIYFHGVLPTHHKKSALQILLHWYKNTATSAKEPSSHSDAW